MAKMLASPPRHSHARRPGLRVEGCSACEFFAERDRQMSALFRQTRAGNRPGIDWTYDRESDEWKPPA
jgi:hypothetical protein